MKDVGQMAENNVLLEVSNRVRLEIVTPRLLACAIRNVLAIVRKKSSSKSALPSNVCAT